MKEDPGQMSYTTLDVMEKRLDCAWNATKT